MPLYAVTAVYEVRADTPEDAARLIRETGRLDGGALKVAPIDGSQMEGPRTQGGYVLIAPDGNRY